MEHPSSLTSSGAPPWPGPPGLISHLKGLGITAIELLPVHQFVNDSHLKEKGLANYWATTPSASSAPHNA